MTLPETIEAAAAALRAGEVTSVELTDEALRKISAMNDDVGAFIAVSETAIEQATEADADLAAGIDRGPLHGIPFGLKDILATKDQPSTANSPKTTSPPCTKSRTRPANPFPSLPPTFSALRASSRWAKANSTANRPGPESNPPSTPPSTP